MTLPEFLPTYDRAPAREHLRRAEDERALLLERYPLASLETLPIEKYAIGLGPGTLCYDYEFTAKNLGSIKGGSAGKFVVYFGKKGGGWRSALKDHPDPVRTYEGLRAGLVRSLELMEEDKIAECEVVPLARKAPSLRVKMCHVYFPDKILPIYAFGRLCHYLRVIGVSDQFGKDQYALTANRRLLDALRAMPELAGWSTGEMAWMLHAWAAPTDDEDATPRLFMVRAGQNGDLWTKFTEHRAAMIGVGEVGDLTQVDSWESLRKRVSDLGYYEAENTISQYTTELQVFRNIRAEDIVAAFNGTTEVLGIGTVVDPGYEYVTSPPVEDFNHFVHVAWEPDTGMKCPKVGGRKNMVKEIQGAIKALILGGEETGGESSTQQSETNQSPAMPASLNHILYGPPGTGKTYRVIRNAVRFIEPSVSNDNVKARYDQLAREERIRFATFHQSFSYEDFIEGIRPTMDGGVAGFTLRPGVFKEIATEAMFACLERALPENGGHSDVQPPVISRRPGPNTITGRVWDIADELCGDGSHDDRKLRRQVIERALAEKINLQTAMTQFSSWRRAKRLPSNDALTEEAPALPEDNDDEGRTEAKAEVVQDFLKIGEASGWKLRAASLRPPYVLVIDEINRGNISRIFGELITLVEDSKRFGREEALTVMLPGSRERFTVPPNLILLGTMNTADKSLALLDVALRRRFEFEELIPDFSCCPGFDGLEKVMNRINERIELRKDRDHRIGHAFFMGVSSVDAFNAVFQRKVVPLLQEYFFGDIDGARFVLGDVDNNDDAGFLRRLDARKVDSKWQRTQWRWFTDEDRHMDCWEKLWSRFGA